MRNLLLLCALAITSVSATAQSTSSDTLGTERAKELYTIDENGKISLTLKGASFIAQWNLANFRKEYPSNRVSSFESKKDVQTPMKLNPAFCGYDDWHSSVHSHWTMVMLLKKFPDLPEGPELRKCLETTLDPKLLQKEIEFFTRDPNQTFEYPYGQSWLLKFSAELHSWNDPLGVKLYNQLIELNNTISYYYFAVLSNQELPDRYGHHENSAFGMNNALDYASEFGHEKTTKFIHKTALDFYASDVLAPINYEPSDADFLAPNFLEAMLMSRVMEQDSFLEWIDHFIPGFLDGTSNIFTGKTFTFNSHLRGYNLTKAYCFNSIAKRIPDTYPAHTKLKQTANELIISTMPSLGPNKNNDSHWLGTFIMLAIDSSE